MDRCHFALAKDLRLRMERLEIWLRGLTEQYGKTVNSAYGFETPEAYLWSNGYELSLDTVKHYTYEWYLHHGYSIEDAQVVAYGWKLKQPDQGRKNRSRGKTADHDHKADELSSRLAATDLNEGPDLKSLSLDLGHQHPVVVTNHQNVSWTTYMVFGSGDDSSDRYIGWTYLHKLGHGYKAGSKSVVNNYTLPDGTQRAIVGTAKINMYEDGKWKMTKVEVLRDTEFLY